MGSSERQYAERDAEELGEFYFRHLSAMTAEKLDSKADIAAELAWRDQQIEQLRAQASAEPWQEFAQHLEWCRTCAEDGVGSCHEGAQLKVAAYAAPQQAPLTAEQVRGIVKDAGFDDAPATARAAFISGLRHGEAAHGISAAKETR